MDVELIGPRSKRARELVDALSVDNIECNQYVEKSALVLRLAEETFREEDLWDNEGNLVRVWAGERREEEEPEPVKLTGSAYLKKVQREYLEEFYNAHPDLEPPPEEGKNGVVNRFEILREDDIAELVGVIEMALAKGPVEVRLMSN